MGNSYELTQSVKSYSAVVFLDGSNVMLDELTKKLLEVSVVVLSILSEGEVTLNLVLNLSVIEW